MSGQEEHTQLVCSIFTPPCPLSDRITPPPVNNSTTPPTSYYPSFSNTLNIADRIGIPATIRTLKRLELAEKTRDPRPLIRAHTPKDNNVVSLDFSGDELDEDLVALVLGPSKSRYAALEIILRKTLTKARSVLKQINSLVHDLNDKKSDLFAASLSDTKMNTPAEWLLDSGASMHFTNNINDFVDYQTTTTIKVVTANGSTQVRGKGAVILVINQKAVRIEPVYHIPDLTTKLISLGQLVQSGLFTRWSARSISVKMVQKTSLPSTLVR